MPSYGYNPVIGTPPIFSPWETGGGGFGSGMDGIGGYGTMSQWGSGASGAQTPGGYSPIAMAVAPARTGPVLTAPASPKLGLNMDTANLALTGLSTLGNLWAAFQAQKLAREQFKYTKNVTDTNLANQIKTYNTTLTDRANTRSKVEGRDSSYAQQYIDANSLKRYGTP